MKRFTIPRLLAAIAGGLAVTGTAALTAPADEGREARGGVEGRKIEGKAIETQGDPPAAAARSGGQTAPDEPEVRREFKALCKVSHDARKRYFDGYGRLATEAEKQDYIKANWPPEKEVVGRMMDLARRHAEAPSAFDALAWVVILGYGTPESDTAAELLALQYGHDKRVWLICQEMRRGVIAPARGVLLRAVLDRNPNRVTRGRACYDLAEARTELANFVQILKTPGLRPDHAPVYSEQRLDRFRALDPAELEADAGNLYRRVLDEFADVVPIKWATVPRMRDEDPRTIYEPNQDGELADGTLAERARPALEELSRLSIGRVAPEIEGQEIDGHAFKLSDYRGRVVVLTFSGTWCGPCHVRYPHEREIVTRLAGRPFALLSVMADEKAEPINEEIVSGEITWRCWWDKGGARGPISTAWNVHAYPTVYVLDHRGVIRLKYSGFLAPASGTRGPQPPIDDFIEQLINEQEGEAGAGTVGGRTSEFEAGIVEKAEEQATMKPTHLADDHRPQGKFRENADEMCGK